MSTCNDNVFGFPLRLSSWLSLCKFRRLCTQPSIVGQGILSCIVNYNIGQRVVNCILG
jgi:hypothetical protein